MDGIEMGSFSSKNEGYFDPWSFVMAMKSKVSLTATEGNDGGRKRWREKTKEEKMKEGWKEGGKDGRRKHRSEERRDKQSPIMHINNLYLFRIFLRHDTESHYQ